jgi:hypothetical protein
MTAKALPGQLGVPLTIDVCLPCQAFWFDGYESLKLAPASVLALFRLIGDAAAGTRPTPSDTSRCPRCQMRLVPTHDMQRATRFEYLRCPARHGRLITFFNFLREKDFIRPMSPQQIAELRARVDAVNCVNCGAPVDLTSGAACGHCGSPLSILDLKQAESLIATLRDADRVGQAIDPALPLELERSRREVNAAFDAIERDSGRGSDAGGLIGATLRKLLGDRH